MFFYDHYFPYDNFEQQYRQTTHPHLHWYPTHSLNPGGLQPQQPTPSPTPMPFLDPGSLQPQQPTPFPTPFPPSGGGCLNRWATMRLRDGRTIQMFVTFIGSKSVAGSIFTSSGWRQIALDLDEIMELTC